MRKTTIYLPDDLKARVERKARTEQRSEADVIRAAIDEFTKDGAPRLKLPLFESGKPIEDWNEAMRGFGED